MLFWSAGVLVPCTGGAGALLALACGWLECWQYSKWPQARSGWMSVFLVRRVSGLCASAQNSHWQGQEGSKCSRCGASVSLVQVFWAATGEAGGASVFSVLGVGNFGAG